MICIHCGNIYNFKRRGYCEECFQKLIAENAELQLKIKKLREELEYKPKHLKEED